MTRLSMRALLLVLLSAAAPALAQAPPDEPALPDTTGLGEPEAVLEPLVDDEISGDPTAVLELLTDLRETPLNVNAATAAELAQIPALSPILAQRIVAYREEEGPYQSLPQVRNVEGVTAEVLLEARPYLTIGEPFVAPQRPPRFPRVPTWGEVRSGARFEVLQRVSRRLDLGRGYDDVPGPDPADTLFVPPTRYAGSPERLYTRLRATYRRQLSLNLTLEKDPGEAFEWRPENGSYGYDYASFHLAALDVGRLDALVLGDFVAEFGQGLALWRASGFGKGREAVRPLIRRGRGIRPYGSTDENRFFRGAAATVAVLPQLYATAFASRRDLDATVVEVDTTLVEAPVTDAIVAGLAEDGLHRTPTELAKKDALEETAFGGALELRLDRFTVGAVGYRSQFAQPLARGDRPYERFEFAGDEARAGSVYGSGFFGDFQLFGEVAVADGEGGASVAALGGVEARGEEL
ncbi:MAG: helix-hairpin-helix domain-containing protein, partial [Rhodothermales bacterium]|nr:helix-hairpin-helix domain-containing protein [Rhodothermales bacterium]